MPIEKPLPFGTSDAVYLPGATAWEILNLRKSDDGALVPVEGYMPYTPSEQSFGAFHGIYHTVLDNGTRDVLVVRDGSHLRVFNGWSRSWDILKSGLSDESTPKYPDVFVEVAGKIVWCNGIDNPVAYDGYLLLPLGYDLPPGAPCALGPEDSGDPIYRNEAGYAHPGRIGTVGDTLSGQDGSVLAGTWHYYVQFEDVFGNLSPLSPASNPVNVRTERTAVMADDLEVTAWRLDRSGGTQLKWQAVVLDDLTKQFVVDGIASGPEGTIARRVFRSKDTRAYDATPCFHTRIPDNCTSLLPDNAPDSELQFPAIRPISVPSFKVACQHAGRLVIGNTAANPGIVMVSEPSLPGTFLENSWCYLTDGDEVTGLFSFEGSLLAFTRNSVHKIEVTNGVVLSSPLSSTIGCVAPGSICTAGWGALLWLGQDGVYSLQGGAITKVSDTKFRTLQRSIVALSSGARAVWDRTAREWCLFMPLSGGVDLRNVLSFDGSDWRSRDYAFDVQAICTSKDHRNLLLSGGEVGGEGNVFVLNRSTMSYEHAPLTYRFVSQWMSLDPTRRRKFTFSTLYLGFIEDTSDSVEVKIWGNGRRVTQPQWSKTLKTQPVDFPGTLNTLTLGTDRVQTPKVFWVKVDVNLRSVDAISFSIEATGGARFSLVGWACDLTQLDEGGRTPRGS